MRSPEMLGVYVHFPYCRKRCPYCDFATFARDSIPHREYADAAIAELGERAPLFSARPLASVYFGGGTPGLWRPDCLGSVLSAVVERFGDGRPADAIEVTCEVNPGETSEDALAALRGVGVNRLSFGVQSLDDRLLRNLGRSHDAAAARAAMAAARRAGFRNVSIDLMYATPGQTIADLQRTLGAALALEPEHVSLYNLTIEPQTPFGQMVRDGRLLPPDSELGARMFELCDGRLAAAGYEHYEVSNYARPGHRARHNTLYWTLDEYLGLGSSAHSFRRPRAGEPGAGQAERFANARSVDEYLAAPLARRGPPREGDPSLSLYERRTAGDLAREALWLGLRLRDGVDRVRYADEHGRDPLHDREDEGRRLAALGLLEIDGARLRPTARGLLFADEIAVRLAL